MKKVISLSMTAVLVCSMILMFAGCGAKGSKGLEYKSNGDGTCSVVGIGTCTDENLVIPKKNDDGDKVVSISDNAFEYSKIKSLVVGDNVTDIGQYAFHACRSLATVTLSKSLVKLGYCAFADCDLIAEIELPETFEEFGMGIGNDGKEFAKSSAFAGCLKLSKINIPKNVKAIYSGTFEGAPLTSVKMDAQFKYGTVNFLFGLNEITEPKLYEPSLLTEMPTDDSISYLRPQDTVELSEPILNVLYASLFGESALVNGEQIVVPAPLATVGNYGKADGDKYDPMFSITSSAEIRDMHWDETKGEYQIYDEEDIYKYNFDEKLNCYTFDDSYSGKIGFFVLDKYLFVSGYSGHFELDKGLS